MPASTQPSQFHLVLLPGLDGTGDLFEPFLAHTPVEATVEVKRYPRTTFLGYEALEERLRGELPNRPFWLLAESFSGPLAARLGAGGTPYLLGVVFAASFVRTPRPFWLRVLPWPWFSRLPTPGPVLRYAFAGGDDSFVPLLRRVRKSVDQGVFAARLQAMASVDASADLARSGLPLLYLRGRRDRLVLPSSVHHIRSLRPDLEVVTFDAPHLLLQSQPEAAWAAIQDFIEREPRGS